MIEGTANYNGMDANNVRGLSIIWWDIEWFFGTWVLQCSHLLERFRGYDGYLASFLPVPVRAGPDAILYSVGVVGLDTQSPSMWARGRLEWLCVELVVTAGRILEK